jgi:hypothetical protein
LHEFKLCKTWNTGVLRDNISDLFNLSCGRDTICDLGGASELANYGEYSGAPSEQQTYDYAKTVLSLMCKQQHPEGVKILLRN